MRRNEIFNLGLLRRSRTVIGFALVAGVIALALSFVGFETSASGTSIFRPLEYSSTVRLLVIQPSNIGVDAYTAIRATERISENLAEIIHTTSFFNKVIRSPELAIDTSVFPEKDAQRRRKWNRMVATEVARGSGILTVTVYHPVSEQAELIARAISGVLIQEGWTYIGGNVQVKEIDAPLNSRFPVRPNVLMNVAGGLVFGSLVGLLYILLTTPGIFGRKFFHRSP